MTEKNGELQEPHREHLASSRISLRWFDQQFLLMQSYNWKKQWITKALPLFIIFTWVLVFFTVYLIYSINLPCPREQPEQVLMDTQWVRSKLTKVVLDTISSHLLGVLIPADIHRLSCDLEGQNKKKKDKKSKRTDHMK